MLFRRVNLNFLKKFRLESFPILITVLRKGRVIELCKYRNSFDICFSGFLTRVVNTKHIFQWFKGFSKGEN